MRIGLVVDEMALGGVETFLLRLGRGLRDAGHDVTVVAGRRPGDGWRQVEDAGLAGICWPLSKWASTRGHARRLAGSLTRARFDVLLLNHASLVQRGLHWIPDEVGAIPVVHNDSPGVYAVASTNAAAWNVAVTISPRVDGRMRAAVPGKPVVFIPHGVDLPPARALADRGAWSTPVRLLYVGRLHDVQKGILQLPPILAACRERNLDVRLTVIGEGPDREALERAFAEHEVVGRVTMLGACAPDRVQAEMLGHHVLLMPSRFEGLPLVSLEAQAAGCVPLASRLDGITDAAIEDGVSGTLLEMGVTGDWVAAIAALAEDPSRWQSMSRAGQRRAAEKFSVERMTAAYAGLMSDVAAGKYPKPGGSLPRREPPLFTWRDRLPTVVRGSRARLASLWSDGTRGGSGESRMPGTLPASHDLSGTRMLVVSPDNFLHNYGGLFYLMQHLFAEGVSLDVYASVPRSMRREARSLPYPVKSLYWPWYGGIPNVRSLMFRLRFIARALTGSFDALLLSDLHHFREAWLIRKMKPGLRLVHYCPELVLPEERPRRSGAEFYFAHADAADLIIDVDERRAELRRRRLAITHPMVVLPNSLPSRACADRSPRGMLARLARTELPADRPIVLYVGNVYPGAAPGTIVDALSRVRGAFFFLAFVHGDARYVDEFKRAVHTRLEGKAHVAAAVPREALVPAIHEADIGLVYYPYSAMPSANQRYAAPAKLFEYMAAGLMAVTSQNPTLVDLVGPCGIGVSASDDSPGGLATAIEAVLSLPPEVRRERGARAERVFRERHVLDRHLSIVASAIGQTLRPA